MSIFSHDIYQNVRTRTIVLHDGCMLLFPPEKDGGIWGDGAWGLPGGGLEPHESLAECARREVLEETGLSVRIGAIAFLLEWVVPCYGPGIEPGEGYGRGSDSRRVAGAIEATPRSSQPKGVGAEPTPFPLHPHEACAARHGYRPC
jgi:8-oxo-dGTP pyrophosphatase MutT (NUDIX family)